MAADSHHLVDGLGYLIHAIGVIADAQRSSTMTTLSDEVTDVAVPGAPADATEALAERLFLATIHFLEIASIHVGRKLGYYAELATSGPATPPSSRAEPEPRRGTRRSGWSSRPPPASSSLTTLRPTQPPAPTIYRRLTGRSSSTPST